MIFIYFIIILAAGFYKNKTSNTNDYLFASRKLTIPSFVATIVTTWYGGILEIGRFSFQYGIVTWVIFGLFYYLAAITYAFVIGPQLYKKGISTIPEYFNINYGIITKRITAIILLLVSSPAPYILILSTLLMHIYPINFHVSILLSIFFSTIYIYFGGYKSIIRTDKVQFLLMFSGFLIMLFFLIKDYGGLNYLTNNVPDGHLSLKGNLPIGYVLSWSLISLVTFIDPSIFQRVYSSNNITTIKKGLLISIIFWILFDFLTIAVGLYASTIIDINTSINPYLYLADNTLSPIFKNIFYISLFAIIMSTIDSFSFISAITIGKDIFTNKYNIIKTTRIGLLITAILSYLIIYSFTEAINIWYVFGSIAASSLLIPFLIMLFIDNKRLKYPELSLLLPITICVLWIILDYPLGLDIMYPGITISLIFNYFSLKSNSINLSK